MSTAAPIVEDASGNKLHVTWCDGKHMRVTPVDGDPMESITIPYDDKIISVSGAIELGRMIEIIGGKTVAKAYTKEQSSNVSEIRYDDAASALDITFRNGGKYRYKEVPQAVFDDAMGAESIGKFVSQKIRGAFESERLSVD